MHMHVGLCREYWGSLAKDCMYARVEYIVGIVGKILFIPRSYIVAIGKYFCLWIEHI